MPRGGGGLSSGVIAAALILLFAWLAVRIYDRLSGRRFLLDLRDKARMALRDVAAWDRFWADNPSRSSIVICLTTLPSRLPEIEGTLKSLLYQSRAPASIRLHLPRISLREQVPYEVPDWLRALSAVELIDCEKDYGPATKFIPALLECPPDQPLLIVDDDKLYPPDLVAHFDALATEHPETALGSSGWNVPADLKDRKVTLWGTLRGEAPGRRKSTHLRSSESVDILQGHSGFLIRPHFFKMRDFLASYASGPEEAFYADDIWMSGQCQAAKRVFPARRFCFVSWRRVGLYDRTSLERRDSAADVQVRTNTVLIRHLRDRWMVSSPDHTEPE